MMSSKQIGLSQVSKWNVIKQSTIYKLKVYNHIFYSLFIYQLIGFLFVFNSTSGTGMSMGSLSINIEHKTAHALFYLTVIWLIISSAQLGLKQGRSLMSGVVTDNKIHHFSNGLLILLMSVIGAVTILLFSLTAELFFYIFNTPYFTNISINYFLELLSAFLYLLLAGSLAYFVTNLVMRMKLIAYLLLFILFISSLIPEISPLIYFYYFLFEEMNVFLFIIKISLLIILLFIGSLVITRQMEVER